MSRSLIFAALILLLVSAGIDPGAAAAAAPTITFSVSDGVSHSDEALVRQGVRFAVDYLERTYGARFHDRISVNVRATADKTNPGLLGLSAGDFLVVFTGAPGWEPMSPALRLQVIIHEFVHIYQSATVGQQDSSPTWFIEGMADYVSFQALESLGLLSADDVYDNETWELSRGLNDVPRLRNQEAIEDFQYAADFSPVYPEGYLAVDMLSGDDPVDRISTYLNRVADGSAWSSAFKDAFGETPHQFYGRFERWIGEEMLAPRRQPASFRPAASLDANASQVTIREATPLDQADQVILIADTDPNAECAFELQDADGNALDAIDSNADPSGLVFWLLDAPPGTKSGGRSVSVECGSGQDRIELSDAP